MNYIALLRGIGPGNPNMRGEKLKEAFEKLGFTQVTPIIASGNVVFQSSSKNEPALEEKIEKGLEKLLGFKRTALVRSHEDLLKFVKKNPFKDVEDKKPNYLVVTFFKDRKEPLATVINIESNNTPDFIRDLEKKHGKEITTRTWKTVHRILKVMEKIHNS